MKTAKKQTKKYLIKMAKRETKKRELAWTLQVKKHFNGTCAFCPDKEYLNAHHIIPREIKEFKYDVLNGVALCPIHHKWGINSAHRNPLWFLMQLEEKYPDKIFLLKAQYIFFLSNLLIKEEHKNV